MSSPKALLAPSDIRTTAATIKGRLDGLLAEAEASSTSDLPAFSPARMHPTVWAAAAVHWTTHEYRVAVREAAEALTIEWKDRLGRHEVEDTSFWQQTLSPGEPLPGKPKLVWPGDPDARTTKSMKGGLAHLASALGHVS